MAGVRNRAYFPMIAVHQTQHLTRRFSSAYNRDSCFLHNLNAWLIFVLVASFVGAKERFDAVFRPHDPSAAVVVLGTMPVNEKVRLVFKGDLRQDAFLEFARHRAGRLDIALKIASADQDAVTVTVEGAADLVDAFEMACSLGPYDCLVLDVVRTAA